MRESLPKHCAGQLPRGEEWPRPIRRIIQIKPLTEEEKKQKLEELREKMAEKRARKAEEDAKERVTSELIRRKQGKEISKVKEDHKLKEANKEAEQRKRDKIEDAKARAAVKAQIEADKKARAEKAAREKALRDGKPEPGASSAPAGAATTPAPATSGIASREFKETRLQIRMSTGGQHYITTLPSDAPLRQAAEFLASQTLTVDVETVSFAQHFPRKNFTRADLDKSLLELGLTPSAVLIATP